MKACAGRKSLQPVWLASLAMAFLLYFIIFDARKLLMVKFEDSRITINVENYNLAGNSGMQALLAQVKSGEKPIFVLSPELNIPDNISRDISSHKDISSWTAQTPLFYPKLYNYHNFVDLPAFSKAVCRKDLDSFIPNVVHFIWFGKLKMTFLQYLSMRSAATVQRPSHIILHTDSGEPEGKYWKSLRAEVPCLEVRYLAKPTLIFGKYHLAEVQHQSHIARLQVLYQEGGIYSNLNVIFVRPFDDLMKKTLVLGKEEEQYYSNSVILAARGASFLTMWFTAYNRRLVDWSTYSIYIPWRLHRENPTVSLHVEEYSMMRPNFNEDDWITQKNWVLDDNYCVHLYNNRDHIKDMLSRPPLELINMDNTLGQLARVALFGTPYFEGKEKRFRVDVHSKVKCSTKSTTDSEYIPNIVHYVLPDPSFTYKHYISVRSAARILQPAAVYIHLLQKEEPDNFYWIRTIMEVHCVTVVVPRKGEELSANDTETAENFYRKKLVSRVLQEHGGIYLTFDVIVTSPFSDLMINHVAMGMSAAYLGNVDVLLSVKNSKFLSEWFSWDKRDLIAVKERIEKYIDDFPDEFIEIDHNLPMISSTNGWQDLTFDYRYVYCFTVTKRDVEIDFNGDTMYNILRSDSLTGEVARIAHFGKPNNFYS